MEEERKFWGDCPLGVPGFILIFFGLKLFLIISLIASSAVLHALIPSARRASLSVGSGTIRPDTYHHVASKAAKGGTLPSITCVTFTALTFLSSVSKFLAPDQPFATKR